MKIYCPACKKDFKITAKNQAKVGLTESGRPTICPQCQSGSIIVVYDIKNPRDLSLFRKAEGKA